MKTVCTINRVKLKNSTVLISQLSIMLYIISQSLLDISRNLMGLYLSQPKKSSRQAASASNTKSQEFCFISQQNILAGCTTSESHILNLSVLYWICLAPRDLMILLDYWAQMPCLRYVVYKLRSSSCHNFSSSC